MNFTCILPFSVRSRDGGALTDLTRTANTVIKRAKTSKALNITKNIKSACVTLVRTVCDSVYKNEKINKNPKIPRQIMSLGKNECFLRIFIFLNLYREETVSWSF